MPPKKTVKKPKAQKIAVRKISSPKSKKEVPTPEPVLAVQDGGIESAPVTPLKKDLIPAQEAPTKPRITSLYGLRKEMETPLATPEEPAAPRSISLYKKIAVSFMVLTVILLAAVFYFSFVKLDIVLIPNQERLSDSLSIDIYDQTAPGQETLAKDKVLGAVEQVAMSEAKSYRGSGQEIIGEQVTGKVTIINNYNKNQPLVATTRLLSSDNKLFRIKETINVPAGGSAVAEIYADEPGEKMAIGPAKFTIPGLWAGLQDKIYGQSQESFVYGQQVKNIIQKEDIDEAVKDIKKVLAAKAEKEIGQNYKGYDRVIAKVDDDSVSIKVDGKAGEEKDKFQVAIEAKVNVVAFSGEEIYKLAMNKLSSVVPDNKELAGIGSSDITYELTSQDSGQAQANINAVFSSSMTIKEDAEIIDRQKIVGLTQAQLEDYLDGFKEIAGYEIKFSPAFIDKVPSLVDRIKIEIRR
ncbi:hypothetical protein COV49_02030 [Candidatus Falkowbacteria bacterium CG11_big_fil_rev_8_21_14_0_20_39_10]|uniref:Baseplate protein J-like domain-containing protein n=1 Tax=Candidatus Falkowbacteria bacterium CG11_big_fil_rev_8_21_14_0_20_39_10 TaxID=1974570 RepID=A0A2M6K976_9BACT|nr:MAG: hypothetical protein COV49_02030 [Candidatus Falkowbacteria bacterium CG11_big_fil_rev_8_21_14_0_20_39_10]